MPTIPEPLGGDFRKQKQSPVNPATQQPQVPAGVQKMLDVPPGLSGFTQEGFQFLPPGTVLPHERQALEQLGWQDGDPIPPHLAEALAHEQRMEHAKAMTPASPLPMDTPPLKMSDPIDIAKLPAAKQKELTDALKLAKSQAEFFRKQRAAAVPGAGPGINEALTGQTIDIGPVASRPIQQSQIQQIPPGTAAPPGVHISPEIAPISQPPQPVPVPAAGSANQNHTCQHCGWQLSVPDTLEITAADRHAYIAAISGGKRFRKRYELFGGQLILVFRGLTVDETDMAYRQIAVDGGHDIENKAVSGQVTYWSNLLGYRTVMSLETIATPDRGAIPIPEIMQSKFDEDPPNTPLKVWYPYIVKHALSTDDIRRVVSKTYEEFEALKAKMEDQARSPNFWQATA